MDIMKGGTAYFLELWEILLEPWHSDVLGELYYGCSQLTCTRDGTQCGHSNKYHCFVCTKNYQTVESTFHCNVILKYCILNILSLLRISLHYIKTGKKMYHMPPNKIFRHWFVPLSLTWFIYLHIWSIIKFSIKVRVVHHVCCNYIRIPISHLIIL